MLTQTKPSLLIVTVVTTVGLASTFYKSQTSCWFTQLIFGTQGWVLPPVQKRPKKSSERLLSGEVEAPIFLGPRPKNLLAGGNPRAQYTACNSRCLYCQQSSISLLKFMVNKAGGQGVKLKAYILKRNHNTEFSPPLLFPSPQLPLPSFPFSHNFNQWNH